MPATYKGHKVHKNKLGNPYIVTKKGARAIPKKKGGGAKPNTKGLSGYANPAYTIPNGPIWGRKGYHKAVQMPLRMTKPTGIFAPLSKFFRKK